mmetsp:Transcript_24546/g.52186  ORF Transcript_24546/g.52186 Transcript_24546/m.52186 type:complete len:91 (-) Transcript_24546:368-640(-)
MEASSQVEDPDRHCTATRRAYIVERLPKSRRRSAVVSVSCVFMPFFSLCRLFFFTRTLLFFGFRLVPSFRAESNLIHSLVTKRAALLFLA